MTRESGCTSSHMRSRIVSFSYVSRLTGWKIYDNILTISLRYRYFLTILAEYRADMLLKKSSFFFLFFFPPILRHPTSAWVIRDVELLNSVAARYAAILSGKPRVLFSDSHYGVSIGLRGEPRVIERLILNVDWQREERSQRGDCNVVDSLIIASGYR